SRPRRAWAATARRTGGDSGPDDPRRQRLDAADGRDAPVDLERLLRQRDADRRRNRPRRVAAARADESALGGAHGPSVAGSYRPAKKTPRKRGGSIAGQDLNLRPPRYEPPRLCTPVPPYSAEMQAPKTVLGHCGAPRTR